MIGYDQALATILAESAPLGVRRCTTAQALGHVLAEAIASPEFLPPFDNSAMDGFAVYAGGATLAAGKEFEVTGMQAAGDAQAWAEKGAWEIMTGAHVPGGLDTVVPVEQVEVLSRSSEDRPLRIRLTTEVHGGQHVRRRGEDVTLCAEVAGAGTLLQPQHIMLLAALGVPEVTVRRRPRVAVISTGQELVDDAEQPLGSGQIRNCNGPFLNARVIAAGADVVLRETVTDDPAAFLSALDRALEAGADIVLSTGAVSMGRYDFIPDTLREIGARIHFHKVRIRPGKPLLFARLPGVALYFGLPGNPVASAVGLRFFVEPALRALMGLAQERPLRIPLAADYSKSAALRFHLKACVTCDDQGGLQAQVLPGQESFRILPMLAANAWIVAGEDVASLAAGDQVDVYGLGHLDPLRIGEVAT